MRSTRLELALLLCFLPTAIVAAEGKVAIRTDFPGGNVVVVKNEGGTVQLAPDLRGGPAWFYWHFEAEATEPGTVTFSFAGSPLIGVRGPAVSRDGGKMWEWLGADKVQYAPPPEKDKKTPRFESFAFTFKEAKQKVRFAVAIPYLQHDLDAFLDKNKANPHLKRSVLTETRIGRRPVDLVQIGKPGDGVRAVLLTARHHACESMASFVLEGFIQEAMSDLPAGVEFRKKYVLYAVPIVDTDGVQLGDQGKNRLPHDHNRDYGAESIYPEIKAIQELADLKKIQFALDIHCPYLRGDIHEAFHFVGLGLPHIKDNLKEYTGWLKEERPQIAMTPVDLLVDAAKVNRKMNSHYFATRENAIFSVCLEVPYTQPNVPLDAAMSRAYGQSMLRAWVRTKFLPADHEGDRGLESQAELQTLRAKFSKIYRSTPKEAEELATQVLESKKSSAALRVEANNLLTLLRLHQKNYTEATRLNEAVGKDPQATTLQQLTSASLRVQIACSDPKATATDVEAVLADAQQLAYPSAEYQAKLHELVSEFFQRRQDFEKALSHTKKQLGVAATYESGKLLNRMATYQDQLKRPADALATRQEAVKSLRSHLTPMPPRSIFGANMTIDLFEAVMGIPTSTLEEKKAAAKMALDHEVVSIATKERIRKALAELEKKE